MRLVGAGVPALKGRVGYLRDGVLDGLDRILGKRSWDRPPRRLSFVGNSNFSSTGDRYLQFFVDVCGLLPADRVLDVGCGVGRVAVPLMRYLSPQGAYRGFDIVKPGIDWCRHSLTPRAGNFEFRWVDVYNATYNPTGSVLAKDLRFPYEDATFDFVFLTSVFTHMLSEDVDHYLSEISRVLKPGKCCLATFFLLNDDSRRLARMAMNSLEFKYDHGGCYVINPLSPEAAVAYEEQTLLSMLCRNGLSFLPPIRYGSWSGRRAVRFQDVVVAKKI